MKFLTNLHARLILLGLILCSSFMLSAQAVDGISINPTPATTADDVIVNVKGRLFSGCDYVDNSNTSISLSNSNSLVVFIDFDDTGGFCPAVVTSFTKPLNAGKLAAGDYAVFVFDKDDGEMYGRWDFTVAEANNSGSTTEDCKCNNKSDTQICDNFEKYNTSQRLGNQSTCWTTWTGAEGGAEDGTIVQSGSNKYLKIQGNRSSGGAQDVVLQLGTRNSGGYEMGFSMYVPTSNKAYYNVMRKFSTISTSTNQWAYEVYCDGNGTGRLKVGGSEYSFRYNRGQWNDFKQYFDIAKNRTRFYVNNVLVKEFPFRYQASTTSYGVNQIQAVNFYPINNTYKYYIDNFNLTSFGTNCLDLSRINLTSVCSSNYVPVCGCNGVTYSNSCEARNAGVKSYTSGECNDCFNPAAVNNNANCPAVVEYVCGCDGKTYFNECTAVNKGIKSWTPGPCEQICQTALVVPDEPIFCPQNYDPVCGCNGKEYYNECAAGLDGVIDFVRGSCNTSNCEYDSFEPNEDIARYIATGRNHYALLCPTGDYDWFTFNTNNTVPNIKIALSSLPDDYDLFLFNSNGVEVARSWNGDTSDEEIIYNTDYGNTYYLLVEGYEDVWDSNDTYRLRIDTKSSPWSKSIGGRSSENDKAHSSHEIPVFDFAANEPIVFELDAAPNPLTNFTNFSFSIPETGKVSLYVTDIQGRKVANLLDGELKNSGSHQLQFDGSYLPNGIYITVLETEQERTIHKTVVAGH